MYSIFVQSSLLWTTEAMVDDWRPWSSSLNSRHIFPWFLGLLRSIETMHDLEFSFFFCYESVSLFDKFSMEISFSSSLNFLRGIDIIRLFASFNGELIFLVLVFLFFLIALDCFFRRTNPPGAILFCLTRSPICLSIFFLCNKAYLFLSEKTVFNMACFGDAETKAGEFVYIRSLSLSNLSSSYCCYKLQSSRLSRTS